TAKVLGSSWRVLAELGHALALYVCVNHLSRRICILAVLTSTWLGGSAPAFAAAPRHSQQKPKTNAGRPNSSARNYKLDGVVTERSKGNALHRSRVIVTLIPGAELPKQFNAFVVGKKLALINGIVLDNLPNG